MLDSPYPFSWTKENQAGSGQSWHGTFDTADGRQFSVRASELRLEPGWAFEFSEVPEYVLKMQGRSLPPGRPDTGRPMGTLAPTRRGDQFRIYATVVDAFEQVLREAQPERIRFKGATGSQTKLYRALLKRWKEPLRELGYASRGAALVKTEPRPAARPGRAGPKT